MIGTDLIDYRSYGNKLVFFSAHLAPAWRKLTFGKDAVILYYDGWLHGISWNSLLVELKQTHQAKIIERLSQLKGGFVFFLVLAILAVCGLFYAIKNVFGHQIIVGENFSPEYYSLLQGSDLEGCRMIRSVRPEVLILGDSHVYAGMNFLQASRDLGKLGGYGTPGFYFTLLPEFLESLITKADYIPEYIIFNTSPRQGRQSKIVKRVKSQIYDPIEKPIGLTTEVYDYVNKIFKRILQKLNTTTSQSAEKI